MIVRKIKEEEYRRTCEVFGIAFEIPMSREQLTEKKLEEIKLRPSTREEQYYMERWAAFDEKDQMMGFLIGFPAVVRFDGKEAVCTCIGGVSSLPQYRGRGVIASCFRSHLKDSYQAGVVFSYLYPFSTVFYRQFGYELCSETVEWEFDIRTVPYDPEIRGSAWLNEHGSEGEAIREVYAAYMKECNLSFVREDCDWNRVISEEPAVEHRYTYVWKNKNNIPKGVLCYSKEYSESYPGGLMKCEAFYFSDEEGLKGLLNHIHAYRSHFQSVRLSLPKHVCLQRYLPEVSGYAFHRKLNFNGMGRVIHAERAFSLARYQGSGKAAIRITDSYLEENNRIFTVEFYNGRCTSVTARKEGDADLVMDIQTFSRCLLGCCDADEFQDENLKKIFYPKKHFICDGF
ncbi:MAG: enhanced intracellular survival protein Eis [Fusicatenibacter sp.]